jgi:hypothetical protein
MGGKGRSSQPTALGRYSHIDILLAETLYLRDLTIPPDIRFVIYLDLFPFRDHE